MTLEELTGDKLRSQNGSRRKAELGTARRELVKLTRRGGARGIARRVRRDRGADPPPALPAPSLDEQIDALPEEAKKELARKLLGL